MSKSPVWTQLVLAWIIVTTAVTVCFIGAILLQTDNPNLQEAVGVIVAGPYLVLNLIGLGGAAFSLLRDG